jgi:hypothetical protein
MRPAEMIEFLLTMPQGDPEKLAAVIGFIQATVTLSLSEATTDELCIELTKRADCVTIALMTLEEKQERVKVFSSGGAITAIGMLEAARTLELEKLNPIHLEDYEEDDEENP